MLVFINGPFGVGKTQVAHELAHRVDGGFVLDPERLGKAMQRMTPPTLRAEWWQENPIWRSTLTDLAADLSERCDAVVLIPGLMLDPAHQAEIVGGLRDRGHDVRHFTLLASPATLLRRLRSRGEGRKTLGAAGIERFLGALRQPEFEVHLDTDGVPVSQVAERLAAAVGVEIAPPDPRFKEGLRHLEVKVRHIAGMHIG